MTTFPLPDTIDSQRVLYRCTCGQLKTIHRIYFCRYCYETRCKDCITHEVDSQFCQQCLEYIPSLDAKLKRNKCAQCYQCPSCYNTLSTRVQLVKSPDPNDPQQTISRKQSYFYCCFCRWTSRDVGMKDEVVHSKNIPEPELPEGKRLEVLGDYYKALSLKEKVEKEKKRVTHRSAVFLLDKYGISSSLSPKVTATLRARMARSSSGVSLSDMKTSQEMPSFKPSVALDEQEIDIVDKLSVEQFYGADDDQSEVEDERNILEKNSLEQMLHQIEQQPTSCKNFSPISQMLVVKRSLRCKKCDHNLSKPEYNPSLIKFKIQLSAYSSIPELRILKLISLKVGQTTRFEITLTNPTQYSLHINLLPADMQLHSTAEVILPSSVLQMTPKDYTEDIADIDSASSKFNDDSNIISFRHGNKIGVYLFVTPKKADEDCIIEFQLKHDYVHTFLTSSSGGLTNESTGQGEKTAGQSIREIKWITHFIKVNLGRAEH